MSNRYDWINLFDRVESQGRDTQVLVMKLAREEYWGKIPEEYLSAEEDGDVFDIIVGLWTYLNDVDHNCCSAEECDYLEFVKDVTEKNLEDIRYLCDGIESGDETAWGLWKRILDLRQDHYY